MDRKVKNAAKALNKRRAARKIDVLMKRDFEVIATDLLSPLFAGKKLLLKKKISAEYVLSVRGADFTAEVSVAGKEYILHVEFQDKNEKGIERMDGRMSEYAGVIYKMHKKPLIQVVIYTGRARYNAPQDVEHYFFNYKYGLIDLSYGAKKIKFDNSPELYVFKAFSVHSKADAELFARGFVEKMKVIQDEKRIIRLVEKIVNFTPRVYLGIINKIMKQALAEMPSGHRTYIDLVNKMFGKKLSDLPEFKAEIEAKLEAERKKAEKAAVEKAAQTLSKKLGISVAEARKMLK